VTGYEVASGGVLVEIQDSGVGVAADRLEEMNRRLDDPPEADVSVSRHMGLFAVSHLAARHGVRVRLRASPPGTTGGLTALVWLPDTITDREPAAPGGWPATAYAHLPGAVPGEAPAATDHILRVSGYYLPGGGRRHGAHERVTTPASAAAPPVIPEAVVPRAVFPGVVVPGVVVPEPAIPQAVAPEPPEQVPAAMAAPAPGSLAASGLPVRIPQANRLPGSAGPEPDEAPPPSVAAATRSADAARSRLGGYQRGTRRAEQQITRDGKRADQERADH